ncbi:phosphatidylserine decarboxylase-domain-containing protein [Pisolithus orientalis]|uniref:phosphatidylserine decarboxylase-domain-containing protein n=1 Tax=Pisolithus orientalis TaxID=936130 RepID=UPI002224E90C|nr:phosphatidylserine decarboxylase-domain-containing protein [Pisolithus orientalis]KAI6000285.1 phosphatidylserine decarboxylase-domain-containing protein [Pisolithus orientalis]
MHSHIIQGCDPKTHMHIVKVGESLEMAISRTGIMFNLSQLQCHYHFTVGQQQVYTAEFQDYIEREGVVYAAFNKMFEKAPPPQNKDQEKMIDTNLTTAPSFGEGVSAMVAAVPYYGIILHFCNTPTGYNMFTHPRVNERFCRVFTEWHEYLMLTACSWLSTTALNAMVQSAGGTPDQDTFDNFFICDTSNPHYGFKSYDKLFIRELKAIHHAMVYPDNPVIINSACSSTIHMLYYNLKKMGRFWIKNTPYSLNHILTEDELVDTFVNGTLIQAMLGSLDYHCWCSPVNGTVVETCLISGATHPNPLPTYYTACLDDDHGDLDIVSHLQDFEPIGLMCLVGVGLGEVSTCNVVVNEGQELKKGDELGQFHFGRPTHCLIFQPGMTVTPIDQDSQPLEGLKVQVSKDILITTKLP